MNFITNRAARIAGAGPALCLALAGCIASGGYYDTDAGYDTDVTVGYSPGYIEPYGYAVGGWGDGYWLGPGRGGDRRSPQGGHGYRRAPATRAAPSIPGGARGGGNRGSRR